MRCWFAVAALLTAIGTMAEPLSPPTRPASTQPKAPPKQIVKMLKGSVRFAIADGWVEGERVEKEKGGGEITFTSPDGVSTIKISIQALEFPLPQNSVSFR